MKDKERQRNLDVLRCWENTGLTLTLPEIMANEGNNISLHWPPSSSSLLLFYFYFIIIIFIIIIINFIIILLLLLLFYFLIQFSFWLFI